MISTFTVFLDALARALSAKGKMNEGRLIRKCMTTPTKVGAIKKLTHEVFLVDKNGRTLISKESANVNVASETNLQEAELELMTKTITNILTYYDI